MDCFISCDWGTTNFRLRLVEAESLQVLTEISSADGIASIFSSGSQTERAAAFENHLIHSVAELLRNYQEVDLSTCVVSGMASSRMGWKELAYASTPQPLDGSALMCEEQKLTLKNKKELRVLLVSGIKTSDDVMRGEEVELVGLASLYPEWMDKKSLLVVLPGTHSKHVELRGGSIHGFETVITGELFSHLRTSPTLQMSFSETDAQISTEAFQAGALQAQAKGAIGSLFLIRSRVLLGTLEEKEAASYLSGLLIGDELAQLSLRYSGEVVIAAEDPLRNLYRLAAGALKLPRLSMTPPATMNRALIAGHRLIESRFHLSSGPLGSG